MAHLPHWQRIAGSGLLALLAGCATQPVIYGDDDRHNYYEASAQERRVADATLMLVLEGDFETVEASANQVRLKGDTAGLCFGERFATEPAPGVCTGFRVGRRTIATAGHCVDQAWKRRGVWVAGFRRGNEVDTSPEEGIDKNNVYRLARVTYRNDATNDYALVALDRDLPDTMLTLSLNMSAADEHAPGTSYTVVGYPSGLPVKITRNAGYVSHYPGHFFIAADTYGGNSGSPVLKASRIAAGEFVVDGILVEGNTDYEKMYGEEPMGRDGRTVSFTQGVSPLERYCLKSNVCADDGCDWAGAAAGEKVQDARPVEVARRTFDSVVPTADTP